MKSMKKFMAALLVMSMVLALASTAFAYTDKDADKYVLFKASAYGYKKIYNNCGHSKDFSNVVLRMGSIAHVVAEKGSWYKIEIPKKSGEGVELIYFNKKYTKKSPTEDIFLIYSTAGSRRGNGAEITSNIVDAIKGIKIKTSGSTKLYKEGSMKSKAVLSLKKGKTVKLTGGIARDVRLNTYFEVKYGKKTGFIPANRLDHAGVYHIMKKVDVAYE